MPKMSDDPKVRAGEEKCLRDVREHGTHVLRVMGDSSWPEFTYTVGLFETFGHPEVILLGVPGAQAHGILNELRDQVRDGAKFDAGQFYDDVIDRFQVTFRDVPAPQREAHFGWAEWFYGDRPYVALQLVVPSTLGPWPWEPEASPEFRALQPILAEVPLPPWARRAPG